MAKKIKSNLSIGQIRKLQQEIKALDKRINDKNVVFVRELAKLGIPIIDTKIAQAQGDSDKSHNTYIELTAGSTYVVGKLVVEGRDLLFIEFGAGVHYNGSVGTSPNPKGEERGYTIGSYGLGKGSQDSWIYKAPTGEWVRSYGTEATMPVYSASQEIRDKIKETAKRVFCTNK